MRVSPCGLPADTHLDPELMDRAFFSDSYRVPLRRRETDVIDLFFAIFGHHPPWLKLLLLVRHHVGRWFGLRAATTRQIMSPVRAASYRAGDTIGPWPVYFLGEHELIAGRDNEHLDFRVSVLKQSTTDRSAFAIVSPVCSARNSFGRLNLCTIEPFHRWGMRHLLSRAARKGRL